MTRAGTEYLSLATVSGRLGWLLDRDSTLAYRRTRVGSPATAPEIESIDFPGIEAEARRLGYERTDSGEWVQRRWPSSVIVDWDIDVEESLEHDGATSKQWVISETLRLPVTWVWALVAASLLALCWIYLPGGVLFWGVCVATYLLFSSLFGVYTSPLDRYLDRVRAPETEIETVLSPQDYKTSCTGPSLTAVLAGVVASGPLFLAGLPLIIGEIRSAPTVDFTTVGSWLDVLVVGALWMGVFWLLGLGVGLLIYLYEDDDVRIRVFPFDLLTRLDLPVPELSGGYLTLLVAAIVPVAALTYSSFLVPVVNRFTTTSMALYFLTPPVLIVASLLFFFYWWVIRNRQYVYERTIDRLSRRKTVGQKLGTVLVLTATSYGLAYLVLGFFEKYQAYLLWPVVNRNPLPLLDTPVLVSVLVVASLPASYFSVGLLYQSIGFVKLLWKTFVVARPVGTTPRVGADLRVLDSDAPEAYALSFGLYRTVVISRKLQDTDLLAPQQRDAIIAHEEGHLDPDANEYWLADGTVSVVAPVFGLLTLTGRNVMYALLDFRERERAADRYAASQTSPEALVAALETLADETGRKGTPASLPFVPSAASAPFVPAARPSSVGALLDRYFGLIFGSFALARAHPDIEERIATIDDEFALGRTAPTF